METTGGERVHLRTIMQEVKSKYNQSKKGELNYAMLDTLVGNITTVVMLVSVR